jgi:hypothetical protein
MHAFAGGVNFCFKKLFAAKSSRYAEASYSRAQGRWNCSGSGISKEEEM